MLYLYKIERGLWDMELEIVGPEILVRTQTPSKEQSELAPPPQREDGTRARQEAQVDSLGQEAFDLVYEHRKKMFLTADNEKTSHYYDGTCYKGYKYSERYTYPTDCFIEATAKVTKTGIKTVKSALKILYDSGQEITTLPILAQTIYNPNKGLVCFIKEDSPTLESYQLSFDKVFVAKRAETIKKTLTKNKLFKKCEAKKTFESLVEEAFESLLLEYKNLDDLGLLMKEL